ncbi:Cullin-associated NEDD8-dissociated protein 1 [Boothiomyces macroporosus]|uniref:Cullin-associated NEDD8-dissociated protein 1 n=1 Tax=Boothiomyces macroporosus TaxID=261099 RepID=A0AAD5Y6C2_9FUNG|nr:Cullin-associated NEDD8-dissociated protein 1 [Boothiomyces macroporosus]
MSDLDSDFRYMAICDLDKDLRRKELNVDKQMEAKITEGLMKCLYDTNTEVQNMSLKLLVPYVAKLQDYLHLVKQIGAKLDDPTTSDIAATSLKIIVNELPLDYKHINSMILYLIPKILVHFKQDSFEIDLLDVLADFFPKFGVTMNALADAKSLQTSISSTLLELLNHGRPVVRKRSINALSAFSTIAPDNVFNLVAQELITQLSAKSKQNDYAKLQTIISALASLCRTNADRMAGSVGVLIDSTLSFAKVDDDDLKENCLQALEVLVQSSISSATLESVINLALEMIKYDPNYDDDEEEMDVDEEEEEEETYSDDDDMSYKVRRAAAKVLSSVVSNQPQTIPLLYERVTPVLIQRFNERQETVRIDVINTLITLVKCTGVHHGERVQERIKRRKGSQGPFQSGSSGSVSLLKAQVPNIVKAISKFISLSTVSSAIVGIELLTEITKVCNGGLENSLSFVIPTFKGLLSNTKVFNNSVVHTDIKIKTLALIVSIVTLHDSDTISEFFPPLVNAIVESTDDSYYKVQTEAFSSIVQFVVVLRPSGDMGYVSISEKAKELVLQLYQVTWAILQRDDVESEVSEKALLALGAIVSNAADLVSVQKVESEILPHLLVRLKNESARIVTLEVVKTLFASSLLENINSSILDQFVAQILEFITKTHRPTAINSLQCLILLIPKAKSLNVAEYKSILENLNILYSNLPDVSILTLGFDLLACMVETSMDKFDTVMRDIVKSTTIPKLIDIIVNSSYIVSGGSGLDSLLYLWSALAANESLSDFYVTGVRPLVDLSTGSESKKVSKETYHVLAKCVGKSVKCQQFTSLITELYDRVRTLSDNVQFFSIIALGEIGIQVDLTQQIPDIFNTIDSIFQNGNESLKNSASYSIGRIALGSLKTSLPVILSNIQNKKYEYQYLSALHELLQCSVSEGISLGSFDDELFRILFERTQNPTDDSTLSLLAECLGKLSLTNVSKYVPILKQNVDSTVSSTRASTITAYRFTLSSTNPEYNNIVKPYILNFLGKITDSENKVRYAALSALHSTIHSRSDLIADLLSQLLPALYEQTKLREDLIEVVDMGPFKNKIDHGLEARKTAYECMASLLDNCYQHLVMTDFIKVVLRGLADNQNEIKITNHLILQKLAKTGDKTLNLFTAELIPLLKAGALTVTKDTAVKQEIENIKTYVQSSVKTIKALNAVLTLPTWINFVEEIQKSTVGEIYESV